MLIGPMISHSFWQKALLVGVRTSTMSFLTMKFCCGEYLFANTWNFIFRRWESCVLPLSRIWPVGTTLWVDTASCLSFRGCAGSRRPRPPPASPASVLLLVSCVDLPDQTCEHLQAETRSFSLKSNAAMGRLWALESARPVFENQT
uniref:uncharacterized protein LOC118523911 isoform X3 n=1 Tax=Halichoerus grypus TaxID=9711 RepID=UPI001659237D|nr:uncharacterized protein LOC118523911 isoform X3 [Halichoerus grypus]